MTRRGGTRSFIRERFGCEPDGCGAAPGEPCRAYVQKTGKTTGTETPDVHAARWHAYHEWALNVNREMSQDMIYPEGPAL